MVHGVGTTATLDGVVAVTAGYYHACALLDNGAVDCWGYNYYGQLGNNVSNQLYLPQPAVVKSETGSGTLTGVTALTAGGYSTCALLDAGTLDCWGDNSYHEVSSTNITAYGYPRPRSGLSGVVSISAGYDHICSAMSDNTAWCWGNNTNGELGDGTMINRSNPVEVVAVGGNTNGYLTGVIAVTAGNYHSCALLDAGTVDCWGLNTSYQLGDRAHEYQSASPVVVHGVNNSGYLSGVVAIDAGNVGTSALMDDGTVDGWGGSPSISTVPAPVAAMVPSLSWSSSDRNVATIGASSGLATAKGSGSTTITANYGTLNANTTLSVTVPVAPATTSTTSTTSTATATGRRH